MNTGNQELPVKNHSAGSTIAPFLIWIGVAVLFMILVISYVLWVDCRSPLGKSSCTRVLFIGNSFTFENDLPGTFTKLARSGGHKVVTGLSAPGGWSLEQHANSQETLALLKSSQWDFVVLQEQSQIPASPNSRVQSMYPAARSLVDNIRAEGATPVFFVTWAHQKGWPEAGLTNYENMQNQIILGYQTIGQELNVTLAPVGYAWMLEHRQNPQLALWKEDGYHPLTNGTYLAACVFYATLFRQSPVGLKYYDGLSAVTAKELQLQAEQVVLGTQ